ncbi:hypothetical protein CC80DRAFT_280583 [Byssothecium circinans]|uniref:Uncharacterized protein n=1 Tax=Byssothecium circinans TaxID=147558 RepID=A0A6A5TAJ8_9PLEO|nr:hypothetical protein CC80DRAFT_280583 [Byssothecium circinans]
MFRNVCTVTVLDSSMHMVNWTQSFNAGSTASVWTPSTITAAVGPSSPPPKPPTAPKASSFYMEIAAMEENSDEDPNLPSYTPKPNVTGELGADSPVTLLVNGRVVDLLPGAPAVPVAFNGAGLLGIDMPLRIARADPTLSLLAYPAIIPPTFWIHVDGWDENNRVDLLPIPDNFFLTFADNLTSGILSTARKLAPSSGVTGLNASYFDPGSIDDVVSGLK